MWHGYCRGRTLHIAWNCWCNLHIYVCILIVPIFLRISLTLTLGIPSPVTHIGPCMISLGSGVMVSKCSLHYTFSKNNLHTNLIINTVTMYILVLLNWNSLEHYLCNDNEKQNQFARVQHFIDTEIYTKTLTMIFKLTTSFDWRDLLERLLDLAGDFSEWSLHSCGGW